MNDNVIEDLEPTEKGKIRIISHSIGAILGMSSNTTKDDVMRRLVRDFMGADREFTGNIATDWGVNNIMTARGEYEMETGKQVRSAGYITWSKDWIISHPDGFVDNDGILMIRCPFGLREKKKPVPFKTAKEQLGYYAEAQFNMLFTNTNWCDFYQWAPQDTKLERIEYDHGFIAEYMPHLEEFYQELLLACDDPDEHLEDPRITIDTTRALQLVDEYRQLQEAEDKAKERRKEVLDVLVKMAGGKNARIGGAKLTKISKDGAIKYAEAVKKLIPGANLAPFRGKPSEYWLLK